MNCLDFRRTTETDPACDHPDFLRHKRECPACAHYAVRAARFESRLKQAFMVAIPDQLESRILMRQAFSARSGWQLWRRRLPQLAATILLAVGLITTGWLYNREPGLDEVVISLIHNAPYALTAKGPVQAPAMRAALSPVGVGVEGSIGEVTFASRCFVRGNLAGHLVVKGKTAPVTIFLIPSEQVTARTTVTNPLLSGILLPSGPGTIAIVGAPGEILDEIEARVQKFVRWSV